MPQISRSDDIYRQLVDEAEENWLFELVAFAIVEEQHIEPASGQKSLSHAQSPSLGNLAICHIKA